MKHFIKGMTLLLAGVSFMACSKDVAFDENAQKEAKAQAEIAQKVATYETAFVNHFGSIASDQDWGFGQASGIGSLTRGVTVGYDKKKNAPENCGFKIPSNITSIKNGEVANAAQTQFNNGDGVDIADVQNPDVDFVNFWMQHFNTAQGSHSGMAKIEVYDATEGWIDITGFVKGNGNDVTYFEKNTQSKGTALLTGMGGKAGDPNDGPSKGKLFRCKSTTGVYSYNYKFLDFEYGDYKFLVLGFDAGNGDWWEFVIRPAIGKDGVVEEGRIMCEDLGDTKDFDFNDVVFDAVRYDDGRIDVTLLAAGGIYPIYVDGVDVHAKLGSMKNTGEGSDVNAYKFTIAAGKYNSIINIPVKVVFEDNAEANAAKYEYVLGASVGKAPQKICAPIGTNWPKEYKDIKDAYSEFNDWVQKNNPKLWMTVEDIELTYSIFID